MSLYPRKLHGPEVKCRGAPWCDDCSYRNSHRSWLEVAEMMLEPKETTMACICDNCGYQWSQPVVAFALKNSLDHWDSCEMCKPKSGAV